MSFNIKKTLEVDYLAARIISSRDYETNMDASAGYILTAGADGKARWDQNPTGNAFINIILPDISQSTISALNPSSLYEFQLRVSDPLTIDITSSINRITIGGDFSNFISVASLTSTVVGLPRTGFISTTALSTNYVPYMNGTSGVDGLTNSISTTKNLYIYPRPQTVPHPILNTWAEDINGSYTPATSFTVDCLFNNYYFALGNGNPTFTFTSNNIPQDKIFGVNIFLSNSTNISYQLPTLSDTAPIKWPGGTAPSTTGISNKWDIFKFITFDTGSNWFGFVSGNNY